MRFYGSFPESVSAAAKRARAKRAAAKLQGAAPVVVVGRKIATSFWGKAWCENLERYADFASRLERGRTYVRNGYVLDLRISRGRVQAIVQGSDTYEIDITVGAVDERRWGSVVAACTGKVASVIELLRGELSQAVMDVVTKKGEGLFPAPAEIRLTCSCPDGARMCKHIAAALYGVGARLDERPELLFTLRHVDAADLVATAARGIATAPAAGKRIAGDLGALFDIELDDEAAATPPEVVTPPPARRAAARKSAAAGTRSRAASTSAARGAPVTRQELLALGVPAPTISAWLEMGVLAKTERRGAYLHTPASTAKVARYARARRKRRPAKR